IKSMRCDRKYTLTQQTPCTSCVLGQRVRCRIGWRKVSSSVGECRYTVKLGENILSLQGCSYTCTKETEEKQCCPKFWGADCYECPGGSDNECSGHGVCSDGITGNGTCVCKENFSGYACQECRDEFHFGPDCKSVCQCQHGICNHGPSGDGSCTCYAGYTGEKCDQEHLACGGTVCEANSLCVMANGKANCQCMPGYRRTGIHCQAQDPCSSSLCSPFAVCKAVGQTKHTCTCKEGYQGDGQLCQVVNPCLNNNGICPDNSTICRFEGAGKYSCPCKSGTTRNRMPSERGQACLPTARCSPHSCHRTAKCEIDPDGMVKCLCQDGEIGDGNACYGTLLTQISRSWLLWQGPVREMGRSQCEQVICNIEKVQRKQKSIYLLGFIFSYKNNSNKITYVQDLCKMLIVPGEHMLNDKRNIKSLWTLSGHELTFEYSAPIVLGFKYSDIPGELYAMRETDLPAANGIIHIINGVRKTPMERLGDSQKTVAEIIASMEIASRFETILENCDLPSILDGPGPFTVFVPSNEAVDKLRDGRLIYLFTKGINKLQELVKHHIYTKAAVQVERLVMMPHLLTMANQILKIRVGEDGRILLGDSEVALNKRDILASNGVIHTLDGIFIPPSIIPILPHRCNEVSHQLVEGSCVDCDALNTSVCPPQSTAVEHGVFPGDCVYIHDPLGLNMLKKGCNKKCNQTTLTPGCCKGFFGHSCTPCPGGFTNPCYGRGNCSDGIRGNGQCRCFEGFKGIACHICSNPNKHGENCDEDCGCVHGICDNRPGSKGVCQPGSCKPGYIGGFCDQINEKCGTSLHCHKNAVCSLNDTARCICQDGYEGDGISCKPIDVCAKPEQGGCSENAVCSSTGPGTATCQCNRGWTGDGKACVAIDDCVTESRGGCHINADCNYIGPGQSSCTCRRGYLGDGYNCSPVDLCTIDNGGCHELAVCVTLSNGENACQCSEGYMGDGVLCYGDVTKELARNYHFSSFYEWVKVREGGNVTVLVPTKEAIQNLTMAEKQFWLEPNMLTYLVRSHFLQGSFTTEQLEKYVGKELPTLNPRAKWTISNSSGVSTFKNHMHNKCFLCKVLLPSVDIPPSAPGLQQQLSTIPSFSKFKELLEQYQLIQQIESSAKYTIFIPGNSSIDEYCQAFNITQLAFVNKVLLNGRFVETRNGMLIEISQVLQVHKNRCSTNTTTVQKSRCAKCDRGIKCPAGSVLAETPGKRDLRHCSYKSELGCYFTCVKVSLVSVCCSGYYGHMCEMCPGKPGNWCSGNGVCQDGIEGNGECQCQEGYHGTACEMCQPGRYGTSCKSGDGYWNHYWCWGEGARALWYTRHGKCNDGLLGDGSCTCEPGFEGVRCDQEIETDLCNHTCDVHANCINASTISRPTCFCSAGYTGNGTYCTEIDPCVVGNGGCSAHADCHKVAPGERTCACKDGYAGDGTVCREIDHCLENNGGCHRFAECVKTGPGLVACNCIPKYSGDGINKCEPIDPCKENNGGCSPLALCLSNHNGNRTCICRLGSGDGFTCRRTIWQEIMAREGAAPFSLYAQVHGFLEVMGSGPYTVFVPHADYRQSSVTFSEWKKKGFIHDLLRYHIVSCQGLQSDDLGSQSYITALSGHQIKVSVKENSVYLNDEAKIIESDITGTNGVLHFIDKALTPYDLKNHSIASNLSEKTITEVAETYGYKIYSRLLQETGLLSLVNNSIHQPFTMLWPTDAAFNSLPTQMQQWLYHKEHRNKLSAYLKGHMIRDLQASASKLTESAPLRTLHGSTISFRCSKTNVGDILVDNGNARIVQRYMQFNVGVAYGVDQLLEPPDLGSRCDEFQTTEALDTVCGICGFERFCPSGSQEMGEIQSCYYQSSLRVIRPSSGHAGRRPYWFREAEWRPMQRYDGIRWSPFRSSLIKGCKRTCLVTRWMPQCCANHYGRDCQVCPGGLEAPCNHRGTCDDGQGGSGHCNCSTAFLGTACEHCAPGRYGPECKECNCTENGICNEGLHGDGFCFCVAGWTGDHCEIQLAAVPQCSPVCHPNAVCRPNNTCECDLHYEGDGLTCTVIDLCGTDNGGCSEHANCTQVGTDVSCSCFPDYEGDGYVCSPIDRCADEGNGGCSEHAICISTGPNARRCECKAGYVGNGLQCLEEAVPPIDRCLEDNGQCHAEAVCTDLHFHDKTVGVFHLQSPKGKYRLSYEEAEASCTAEGATLATLQQLSAAQQMGFHLCLVGWLNNQTAGYPTVYPSKKCGVRHVGIVNYGFRSNVSERWDAYCYRAKDVECACKDGFIGDGYTCIGNLLAVLGHYANFSIYYSMILDYANATQEGADFFDFLFTDMTYKTLFVPLNSGFVDNASLTLNDLRLHVSLSDVYLLSVNLTAGTIIPSQAGFNLSIADSVNNTQPLGSKMINNTLIVEWDILASNGIIHAIESPLVVPLQHRQIDQVVSPVRSPAAVTIGVSTVAIVLLLVAIAGLSYFYLKKMNQRFQFRYFKAELEDEEPSSWEERSPNLVSIPNPIYGADSSIFDPFEDSLRADDFSDTHGILGHY
ncbi:hypothetical protein JRQ81_002906, partial [Phrynocephalus forsythii]